MNPIRSRLKVIARVCGLATVTLLQGCVFFAANLVTPNSAYGPVQTVAYGELERQALDIYEPVAEEVKNITLVFFYGGGWTGGEKGDYAFIAQAFTKAGYRVVIPDYRVYPDVRFPTFVEDSASAVAEVANRYPEARLVFIGHSAGAHIAALLALDDSYLKTRGFSKARIKAWVGWSGPYDFLPLTSQRMKKVFPHEKLEASQPINFVEKGGPPALLIQGLDDSTVIPRNSQRLSAKLQAHNVPVKTIYYPGVGHFGTVGALVPLLSSWSDTLPDTLRFLEQLQ